MASLLDAGADPDSVRKAVESVGCGFREISREERHHISAARVRIHAGGKRYRTLSEARSILTAADLAPQARDRAMKDHGDPRLRGRKGPRVSGRRGVPRDQGHGRPSRHRRILSRPFEPRRRWGSRPADIRRLGDRRRRPRPTTVPAPATLEILKGSRLLWRGGPVEGELLTPTGAAILGVRRRGCRRISSDPGRGLGLRSWI